MATTTTATSNFSALVQETVRGLVEKELRAARPHAMPGNYRPATMIPGTNLLRFARYADLAAQTTALTEGTAPTDQELTIASESFSATQLGGTIALSDLAALDSPNDLIAIAAERAADQAARSMDNNVKTILQAATSVQYSNGSARSAVSAVASGDLIKRLVARLVRNNVPRFGDGFYRCIMHPFVQYDIFADTASGGWMDATRYVDNLPMLAGELGAYHGVRFQITSNASVFTTAGAGSVDVYSSFFFGPEAYALGDSQTLNAYFTPFGNDHSDPIAQKAIVGWKVRFGAALLDEAGPRYIRLESAATLT